MQDTVDRVRIAVVQYELRPIKTFSDFAQQCAFFVRTAAGYNADFVLFPELFTLQLLTYMDATVSTLAEKMEEAKPDYEDLFTQLSSLNKINIIAGSHLCYERGQLYNVSFFFDRQGKAHKQYKLHITPHERDLWNVQPGNSVEVIETDRGKISILICYDIEFPELSRIAVDKGARIIFCPSSTDQRAGYLRVRYCAQARCIENQVYVALSGCAGNTPMLGGGEIHYSQAAIFTPSDITFPVNAVAAEAPENTETMIIQDLDLSLLERNRQSGAVRPWFERRSDLYQVHYREGGKSQVVSER